MPAIPTAAPAAAAQTQQMAAIARALAHPARVQIITFLLSRPGCIGGDIVQEVGLAQSTVSEHLRILPESGLIVGTIQRPRIGYWLDPSALAPLHGLIARIQAWHLPQEARPACHIPESDNHSTGS